MLGLLYRLRKLFRCKDPAFLADSRKMGQYVSSSRRRATVEEPSCLFKSQVDMSSTRVMQFMYHHYLHCVSRTQRTSLQLSSDSFTLFPLLPPELRLRIWEAAAAEPHVVELTCTPVSRDLPQGRWLSHTKSPNIFHISSESRAVALREFSVLKFSPGQIGDSPSILYINFSSGCLWLCADLAAEWARNLLEKNEQLQSELKSLVVNERLWKGLNPNAHIPAELPTIMSKWQTSSDVFEGLRALESVRFHS